MTIVHTNVVQFHCNSNKINVDFSKIKKSISSINYIKENAEIVYANLFSINIKKTEDLDCLDYLMSANKLTQYNTSCSKDFKTIEELKKFLKEENKNYLHYITYFVKDNEVYPIGLITLYKKDNNIMFFCNIVPQLQRKGFGTKIIKGIIVSINNWKKNSKYTNFISNANSIIAIIRSNDIPSNKVLKKASFKEISSSNNISTYEIKLS